MIAQKNGTTVATGLVLGAAVLWGTVGPSQVLADTSLGPAALGRWRLLVGGLVLGAFTTRDPIGLRALTARSAWRPLLVCTLSTGLYQVAFLGSVSRTGAALATVVTLGTAPAATGLCARWATGERVGTSWLVSTGAAVVGCALLLGGLAAVSLPHPRQTTRATTTGNGRRSSDSRSRPVLRARRAAPAPLPPASR